jgi:zinc protease
MRSATALLVVLLACPLALAQAPAVDIPYDRFQLANGLDVIVHEDRKAPVVAVSVWYGVGSRDEPEGKSGFAHLFEHLMFNGSENYDDEWFKPMEEVGATDLNGTTSSDRTNYFQTVPTPALERALWLESDRMGHLLGAVTQAKLDEQRGVVQNEKRQRENQPYGRVFEAILSGLFPKAHPYHHTTIGSMADLEAASLEDVRTWFRTYYGPGNAVLVLAGDIDADTARPLVERYFADIPAGPPVTRAQTDVPDRTARTRTVMEDRVPQPLLSRNWAVPGRGEADFVALDLAARVLGSGLNSRLSRALVVERGVATNASAYLSAYELAGIFNLVVRVQPGEALGDVSAVVDQVLSDFLEEGPTQAELDRVRTAYLARRIRGLEKVGGFGGKATTLAQGALYEDDPGFYRRQLAQVAAATPRGVRDAARRWLADGDHQVEVVPFGAPSAAAEGVDRSTGLPSVTASPELEFPDVRRATLSNGIEINLARRDAVPLVELAITFDAGYAADAGGKLGVANFATEMLDEGTGSRDALGLAAEFERLGAVLDTRSNLDATTVRLSALTANLETSVALWADVIRDPVFPEADLERLRRDILAGIGQEKANPRSLGLRLLPPLLYGNEHPYGLPFTGSGSEAVVESVTRADLVAFQRSWLRPDNAVIHAVGDVSLDRLVAVLEDALGDWRAPATPLPRKTVAPVPATARTQLYLVDKPAAAQSVILAGRLAPPPDTAAEIALDAMNEALGGKFSSRINLNLREDKGWSYGARSVLVGARAQRPWLVFAPVQTDRTGDAVAEILAELRGYVGEQPFTAQELEDVRLNTVRALPGRYETSSAVLRSILESSRYGRPLNYPETLAGAYSALEVDAVREAAGTLIRPDELVWVIVGDRAEIEAQVRALDLGELRFLDADGQLLD